MTQSRKIPLAIQTLFSDLEQRTQDADFTETFDKRGTFKKMKRGNRYYWYWQYRDGKKVIQKYAGPITDAEITKRVERFRELKDDFDQRREIVRALLAAGLPMADTFAGTILETLVRAGFFRLRGILVGTTAYQCYSGILGIHLSAMFLRTQDTDLAQYFAISQQIDDTMPPLLPLLKSIDETFREVPHMTDPVKTTAFVNSQGFRVEFLTPNRGSDEYQDKPASMPALGGAAAQPLRFLDFLIRNPMRSVILHEAGLPVTIPSPERFLVHKLIVSDRRDEIARSKSDKDIEQVTALIRAMTERYALALSEVWQEAWERGPGWRTSLAGGLDRLDDDTRLQLQKAVFKGAKRRKLKESGLWPE